MAARRGLAHAPGPQDGLVAHPDDAEITMDMRVHWYALNGARVRVHCLTIGAPGPDGTRP